MKVLVFDTETTGLLPKKNAPEEDYPYIVQMSWMTFEIHPDPTQLFNIQLEDYYVNPPIPITNAFIHGVTNEIAEAKGTPLTDVLNHFKKDLEHCEVCVAHNAQFDINVLEMELKRNDIVIMFPTIVCTMQETIEYCAIQIPSKFKKGEFYMKFPKLLELHEKLFKESPQNIHNSKVDVLACARCFIQWRWSVDVRKVDRHYRRLYRENCLTVSHESLVTNESCVGRFA